MAEWLSANDLVGAEGLPNTVQNINAKAKREDWKWQPRKGKKGGGKEYHISSLPPETQQALRAKAKPTLSVVDNAGKTPPTFTQRDENGLTPDEVALLLKYRALDDQLKTQSQSILDIFSQQKINQSNDE